MSLAFAIVFALNSNARAITAEEDEARIEVLIKAERSAPPTIAATPAVVGAAATPVVASTTPAATSTKPATAASSNAVSISLPASVSEPADYDAATLAESGQSLRFDDLKQQIGGRVYIVTTGGNSHLATVQSVDAKQVTLTVHTTDGAATYTLRREQIASVEAR